MAEETGDAPREAPGLPSPPSTEPQTQVTESPRQLSLIERVEMKEASRRVAVAGICKILDCLKEVGGKIDETWVQRAGKLVLVTQP